MERQAKIATVELKADNGQILLRLTDDGKCKDPGRAEGIGLAYMRALLLSLGGTLKILPGPGGSTVTEASVPIAHAS
jgi:signal transduction histidine kinase